MTENNGQVDLKPDVYNSNISHVELFHAVFFETQVWLIFASEPVWWIHLVVWVPVVGGSWDPFMKGIIT